MSSEGFESLIKENVVLIDYEFVSTLLINVLLCLFQKILLDQSIFNDDF